ncbi:MAG: pilus assembly protein TadG-related protein [Chloroflexota bacterium]
MKQLNNHQNGKQAEMSHEQGQSIVIIALGLVGLLALLGLAVDVGLVFVRGAQLQAAVDAAALAGVTELQTSGTGLERELADARALQFIQANEMPDAILEEDDRDGLPFTVIVRTDTQPPTDIGLRKYSVEADWEFELFFLRIVGFNDIQITRRAEAAYFPLTDIYASRRVEDGIVSTSNQGVFGPAICERWGDPFSPRFTDEDAPKPRNADGTYTYTYRILVPEFYRDSNRELQIELFDPDSINQDFDGEETAPIVRSNLAVSEGLPATADISCESGSARNRWNPCLIDTGETELVRDPAKDVDLDQINPYWIMRIDENRGTGSSSQHGDYSCTARSSYDPYYNTETKFELYYFREGTDGTAEKVPLSTYTGQVGDGIRDEGNHLTDLRWVTPGVTPGVPQDEGLPFLLDLQTDVGNILIDPNNQNMYVYLDVTGVTGASENGFEIWAGPPIDPSIPLDVNERNLYLLNNPGSHNSQGAIVFALGNLPMNSNFGLRDRDVESGELDSEKIIEVDIPLIYVGPEFAGSEVNVRMFDTDAGATPPIMFYFDTVSEEDWSRVYGEAPPNDDIIDRCFEHSKIVGKDAYECNADWTEYEFTVPGIEENCPPGEITNDSCTPFYGGRLVARYRGGFSDSFGWQITLDGLPFLTE